MQASKTCCDSCPLKSCGARGFVPDDIPTGAQYIVRGEAPGSTELVEGKPFTGKAGFVLKNWIIRAVPQLQVALEKGKVGFSNNLKCLPPETQGRPYPQGDTKRKAEEHCRQFTKWPESVKTAILCGEHPQRFYFGEELDKEDATDRSLGRDAKGVMGRVGRVYDRAYCFPCQRVLSASEVKCEACGGSGKVLRWTFAPHPAYILRQPALVGQAQEAFKIAVGMDKVLEPAAITWQAALCEILNER